MASATESAEPGDIAPASRDAAAQGAEAARAATERMLGAAGDDRSGRVPATSALARAVDNYRARMAFDARSYRDQLGVESARRTPEQPRGVELDGPEQDHGYDPTD